MTPRLERNLVLIPWHQLLVSTSPWIAIFVLFTRSRFGLDGAIALAGIYYLAVVVFEVPSGWMSDRLGRVLTLRIAASAWVVAFSCFLFGGESFAVIVAGQAFMALGYASLSGTDVTFHYDTLESLGRHHEYPDRQGSVASRGLVAAAAGAFLGGLLGLIDLRFAFAASLFLALLQLATTLLFTEPPRTSDSTDTDVSQLVACARYLRSAPLAWIFGYGIAMVVLEHVAFTLLQPWLTEVLDQTADDIGSTPLVSGTAIAVMALVGAAFARSSPRLARRFGVRSFLVGLSVLSAFIVTAMASSTHLVILIVVAFRSAQGAAAPIVISTVVASSVAAQHRATLLSLNSLAGRLSYGGLLVILSADASAEIASTLRTLAVISWLLVALIVTTGIAMTRRFGPDHSL